MVGENMAAEKTIYLLREEKNAPHKIITHHPICEAPSQLTVTMNAVKNKKTNKQTNNGVMLTTTT